MFDTTAVFETEHGGKYLTQLCRHFAHKVEVLQADDHGECRFSCGTAALHAEPGRLRLRVSAPTREDVAELQTVIESHLLRFAFREGKSRLDWTA